MVNKKALIVGIDNYEDPDYQLSGCRNDAERISSLLSKNEDGSSNFDVKTITDDEATSFEVHQELYNLFHSKVETVLFFFSGHGCDNNKDGKIVCYDCDPEMDAGFIEMKEIAHLCMKAKATNKIIILDCCYSGKLSEFNSIGDKAILGNNTIILTACSPNETAAAGKNNSLFTSLLIGALEGMGADVLGRVTPASIYSFVDQSLGAWEQRPYFKANVSSFVTIRNVIPKVPIDELRKGLSLFPDQSSEIQLDSSFEDTNVPNSENEENHPPYANPKNTIDFKLLQELQSIGLVEPVGEKYMYYAAMRSKSCRLTFVGKLYWDINKKGHL